MNRFTLTLVAILLLLNSTVLAQDTYVLDFNYQPTLKDQTVHKKLIVIDNRKEKANVGYLRKGGRKRALTMKDPLDISIQQAYDKMTTGATKDMEDLVLVIYDFEIQDKLDGDESGTFYFDGDFFIGSANKYQYLTTADSFFEMRAAVDVTKMLVHGTQFKIESLLKCYATTNGSHNGKIYSLEELSAKRTQDKLSYPIYNTTQHKKGIYYTIDQFLNNTPVDTPITRKTYTRDGTYKMHYFYYQDSRGRKGDRIKESDFFAVYDGSDWWVSNISYCTILRFRDGDFYATKFFSQPYVGASGSLTGGAATGVMFGIAGALVGAAIGAGIDAMDNGHKEAWGLYVSRFDPMKKEFTPVDRPHIPQ